MVMAQALSEVFGSRQPMHGDLVAGGWVYIMSNGPSGTLYVGVTADLARRVWQHRTGRGSDFCRTHGLTRLVYVEEFPTISEAIVREKAIKEWRRSWKLNLIGRANPDWHDLYDQLNT
jgi:putative endonuclease